MPSNNFKNVSKMLAKRFAFKQAAHKPRSWVIDDTCNPVGIRKIQSNTFHKQIKQVLIHHFDAIDFQEDLVQCNKLFYHNNEISAVRRFTFSESMVAMINRYSDRSVASLKEVKNGG